MLKRGDSFELKLISSFYIQPKNRTNLKVISHFIPPINSV
jgi:hypothetical protein